MCQRYIRKLDEVEAFQYYKGKEMPGWVMHNDDIQIDRDGNFFLDEVEIKDGDYIVKDWRENVYVVTKEIFEYKYKEISEEAKSEEKVSLSDKIAEDVINQYCSKISVLNIDVYEDFIGERVIVRIEDGNKKHFRKKKLKGIYWDIASVEEFERRVEGLIKDYAELQNKSKIYKKKRDILLNKLLEDYHKYDRSDEFDK